MRNDETARRNRSRSRAGILLVGRHGSRVGARVQRPASTRRASRTRPTRRGRCPASRATRCTRPPDDPRRSASGPNHQLGRRWTATTPACSATARVAAECAAHTKHRHPTSLRQRLLQLPHAVHDLRPAESDAQPSDQQSFGRGERRDRPAERVQSVPSRQDARMDIGVSRAAGTARPRRLLARTSVRLPDRCFGRSVAMPASEHL